MSTKSESPALRNEVATLVGSKAPVLEWIGETDGALRLLDQTLLPCETKSVECRSVEQVVEAIRSLRVRGAPAIGVAAAYGVVVGVREAASAERSKFDERLSVVIQQLAASRPTAVNLFWALERQRQVAERLPAASPQTVVEALLTEARAIETEDRAMCSAIGRYGAELLTSGDTVLTHCNAGALATAGDGTALAVIYAAVANGKQIRVFADETRPLLQGARLTAWELSQRGVPVTLICDSMAATVMRQGKVHAVIVGADRIAANGDTANKIGTYSVACLAKTHGIPFYVAAPSSTFDLSLSNGDQIPIEERSAAEITHGFGRQTAPEGIDVYNPAFDVTPAELITAIITERGVIRPVNADAVRTMLASARDS
ncbi:MAG: S-methyl-5-thioribose-1-phosphate isomerase [Planctomycetaceae bacterium]|nr:S-methyl-5-thioribose-1-phosphate isomerase [Planctomycetaceae bacterium]